MINGSIYDSGVCEIKAAHIDSPSLVFWETPSPLFQCCPLPPHPRVKCGFYFARLYTRTSMPANIEIGGAGVGARYSNLLGRFLFRKHRYPIQGWFRPPYLPKYASPTFPNRPPNTRPGVLGRGDCACSLVSYEGGLSDPRQT